MDISDPHATEEGLQGTTFLDRLGKGWEKKSRGTAAQGLGVGWTWEYDSWQHGDPNSCPQPPACCGL